MKITIAPIDKTIVIDGNSLIDIKQDLSWIPSDIHAVQWFNDHGWIEYVDNRNNLEITELGIYEQAIIDYNNEIKRIEDEILAQEASRDYWVHLRFIRNDLLTQSDWTQLPDSPLSTEKQLEWIFYRNNLRNLPDNIEDPKPLALNLNHPSWPIPPA
jgi:hypothetical protein